MRADLPNTLKVSNPRVAACLSGLGFPWSADATLSEKNGGQAVIQFLFGQSSVRFPDMQLLKLITQYESGELQKTNPMHPLCVMMRGQHNYDTYLSMLQGVRHCLRSVDGGCLTIFRPGQELASITQSGEREDTDDLCLAAAMGGVGIPLVSFSEPQAGYRIYHLARTGHPVMLHVGGLHLHDARDLMRRSPTPEDPLRLALEVEQPLHPLCLMYDGLHHRRVMREKLSRVDPLIMMDEGGSHVLEKSGAATLMSRKALVHANASGRVLGLATKHMKSPPIDW